MIYLLIVLTCCNLALTIRNRRVKQPDNFHPDSYNLGIRDAGEVVRDVRIEAGIARGEHPLLEEIFGRLRKCRK